jgi:ribonuclease R
LAKAKYTHFTSPIRRYADLVVHRALFQKDKFSKRALFDIADHISATERNSADAERDSKDVKLFAYLQAQLDSGHPLPYPALIIDVRNFGFFVDVPDLAMSGMIRLSSLEDDFYVHDPVANHLVGRRTRRIIRLGDNVVVQIARIDRFKKQVDFALATTPVARPRGNRVNPSRRMEPNPEKRGRNRSRRRGFPGGNPKRAGPSFR